MAKSAKRRAEAQRILNNWIRTCKESNHKVQLKRLSMGRVFKQDPYDCGNTKCEMCNPKYSKSDRQSMRREEAEELERVLCEE